MNRLALITGLEMPRPDPETPLLITALADRDIAADLLPWRGASSDWDAYELIVLRTPWDYTAHAEAWLAWIDARQLNLENPADVVTWTSHKRYLLDLAGAGVPVIPTVLVPAGADAETVTAAAIQAGAELASYDVVVKPAIGVGGRHMERAGNPESAVAHAQRLLTSGDVVLQPFQADVLSGGEISVICFDGRFSHAVRKRPATGDFRINEHWGGSVEPYTPTDDELRVAEAAIACAPEPTLYARVDLIGSAEPRVGELELVEPELYLRFDPAAAGRFAEAIGGRLGAPAV